MGRCSRRRLLGAGQYRRRVLGRAGLLPAVEIAVANLGDNCVDWVNLAVEVVAEVGQVRAQCENDLTGGESPVAVVVVRGVAELRSCGFALV